jgi:hypothetical protein
MRSLTLIVFSLFLLFSACAEPDSCEHINKTSDCLKYNNCNILENWKLRKIVRDYSSAQDTFTKQQLYQDLLLVYNDGTMELRINNVLSPLNKWEFKSCKELKLFSSISDSSFVMTIDKMDADAMVWKYSSIVVDSVTWKVVNSLNFDRM